jgi:hypothetical protein
MKIIPDMIKKKYIELYTKSKLFRNFTNSLGIGIGSSFFYGMTGGTCPCCGKGANTCAIGLGAIGFFGLLFGVMAFFFLTAKDAYVWIRSKFRWKEKKLSS